MKLLACRNCSDVFSLRSEERTCECGSCGGRYVDSLHAEVWGAEDFYFVLGFDNQTLSRAIREQIDFGDSKEIMGGIYGNEVRGRNFSAFIIPESARSVKRENRNAE